MDVQREDAIYRLLEIQKVASNLVGWHFRGVGDPEEQLKSLEVLAHSIKTETALWIGHGPLSEAN